MASLDSEELKYRLPGGNPTLGQQCLAMGEIEQSYLTSFQDFTQDFNYRHPAPAIAHDLERLSVWLTSLDNELFQVLEAIPAQQVEEQTINRGENFIVDLSTQLTIYREALLIFYGKVSVYLKAMGKELPGRWGHWIE
jgi:hypothetical protein